MQDGKRPAAVDDEQERRAQLERIRRDRRAQEEHLKKTLAARKMSLESVPLVSSVDARISNQADLLLEEMFGDDDDDGSREEQEEAGASEEPVDEGQEEEHQERRKELPTPPAKRAVPAVGGPAWKAGDEVEAVWLVDEVFYVATIVAYEGNDMYEVLFTEYGNRQLNTPAAFVRPLTPDEVLEDLGLAGISSFSADALGAAEWHAVVDRIVRQLVVRDFQVGGELLRRVFDGYAAVTWLVANAAELCPGVATRLDALRVYQRMVNEKLIVAVQAEDGEETFFTDGGVLFMLSWRRSERTASPPVSPKSIVRSETLADVRNYLQQQEAEPLSSDLHESSDDNDETGEEDELFIASVVLERKQTLLALPAAKRQEQESQLKRIQTRQESAGWTKGQISPRTRQQPHTTSHASEERHDKAENRKSATEGRLPQARPRIPEFAPPHVQPAAVGNVSAPVGGALASPHSPKHQLSKTDSRNNSPQASPRRADSPRALPSPRAASPRQQFGTSPQSSPRPQVAVRSDVGGPSSPRPVGSVRTPASPRRALPLAAPAHSPPAMPPSLPQTPSSPPAASPRLPPLVPPPPPFVGVARPAVSSGGATSPRMYVSPRQHASQPPPPSHQPRDPVPLSRSGIVGTSSGSLPRPGPVPAPAVRLVNLPRQVAAPNYEPPPPQESFLGIALIGQSFVAERAEQLSVVAGTTVMVLARPTKNWLVAAVGASVGAIPVACVRLFTPAPRQQAPVAAGRGAGRGRGMGRGAGRRF